MTEMTKVRQKPAEQVKLEKNYGKVACKGVLGAAQLARRPENDRVSKGFASQTSTARKS